jgi:hypothetical protein
VIGSLRSVDQEAEPGIGLRCIRRAARDAVSHGAERSVGLDCLTVTTIAAYGSWFF